jgi:hypothetical protein
VGGEIAVAAISAGFGAATRGPSAPPTRTEDRRQKWEREAAPEAGTPSGSKQRHIWALSFWFVARQVSGGGNGD